MSGNRGSAEDIDQSNFRPGQGMGSSGGRRGGGMNPNRGFEQGFNDFAGDNYSGGGLDSPAGGGWGPGGYGSGPIGYNDTFDSQDSGQFGGRNTDRSAPGQNEGTFGSSGYNGPGEATGPPGHGTFGTHPSQGEYGSSGSQFQERPGDQQPASRQSAGQQGRHEEGLMSKTKKVFKDIL